MEERLVQYFEQQMAYAKRSENKKVFFDHCFGAVDFIIQQLTDEDQQNDLVHLWEEWRVKWEGEIYGI